MTHRFPAPAWVARGQGSVGRRIFVIRPLPVKPRLHEDRAELTRALMAWERLDAQAERDHTQTLLAQL
jgi:hypothetical protein